MARPLTAEQQAESDRTDHRPLKRVRGAPRSLPGPLAPKPANHLLAAGKYGVRPPCNRSAARPARSARPGPERGPTPVPA